MSEREIIVSDLGQHCTDQISAILLRTFELADTAEERFTISVFAASACLGMGGAAFAQAHPQSTQHEAILAAISFVRQMHEQDNSPA